MICKICGSCFLDEEDLFSLFMFSDICPNCKKIFHPEILSEVFPFGYGEVHYYYLYEHTKLSIRQEQYLTHHLKLLYTKLLKEENIECIIYLDDEIMRLRSELSLFISGFKSVYIFSLVRQEIVYLEDVF